MALDDRDYMRDRIRQRNGYTERSTFRRSNAGETDYRYFPKAFRGQRDGGGDTAEGPSIAGGVLWRTFVICLAVYGALAGVRDIQTWKTRRAAATIQQERERKERAWNQFYQDPAYCAYAINQAKALCLSERAEARRQFELSYSANQR